MGSEPLHAPVQPPKVEPVTGVATRETFVPTANVELQLPPQEIPEGLLVTVPAPPPVSDTVSLNAEVVCVFKSTTTTLSETSGTAKSGNP